jgi:glycosyltransferase involved in cell wall biosynthesis
VGKTTKIAIVYDRIVKWGGAERLLLDLNKIFPQADLFTSIYKPQSALWAQAFPQVKTSFLNRLPNFLKHHEFLAPLMPLAFESFDFSDYNLVLSVTSEFAKAIVTPPKTKHICILLTPTRYLWSHQKTYGLKGSLLRYFQKYDQVIAHRPDKIIAISHHVAKRCQKYYGLKPRIIYPPASVLKNPKNTIYDIPYTKYYLVVSRLVKYKKVDLAIKACQKLKRNLVIVGAGHQQKYLRSIANPQSITFYQNISDQKLAYLYQHCQALLMPQEEDLGLVALEAQSFGKPVITYSYSGATELIKFNQTGFIFKTQSVSALIQIIKRLEKTTVNPIDCINHAKKFSFDNFKTKLLCIINE